MKSHLTRLPVVLFVAVIGQAQLLTDHAAAAAGAAVGTAGGKVMSNVLNSALAPAAQTGDPHRHDGGPERKVPAAPAPAMPTGSLPEAAPQSGSGSGAVRTTRRSTSRSHRSDSESADRISYRYSYEKLPPPPSLADFAKLEDGSSKEDVLKTLGIPSSHVTIPNEGHMLEIMSYQDSTHRIGTVKVDNGVVVDITTAAR